METVTGTMLQMETARTNAEVVLRGNSKLSNNDHIKLFYYDVKSHKMEIMTQSSQKINNSTSVGKSGGDNSFKATKPLREYAVYIQRHVSFANE